MSGAGHRKLSGVGSRTDPHIADPDDAERVTEILTDAFYSDPVWGWTFPDAARRREQHSRFWRLYVDAAISYGSVRLSRDRGAAAVWIPPGQTELREEDEARLEPMLTELVGPRQTAILMETFDRFEDAHPREEPHYYLSLLGTHSDHRGRGVGMGLLADCLETIDAEERPAYLESTNPANDHRYERLGFERVGEFSLPQAGPRVATMWRPARA